MPTLPYPVYDADHHIYETPDTFLRHLPKAFEKEFYFVEVKGRTKLVANGVISDFIPNPTFTVVAAPGTHEKWYRAANAEGLTLRQMTGTPLKTPEAWRSAAGQLKIMDQHGLHAALFFPTLASAIEARFEHKPEVISALFTSMNTWLIEEWGFARDSRLYTVPMVGLSDVDDAVRELETVMKAGARCIGLRPAPVPGLRGSRSPGYQEFDPFWARCAEAKIMVCFHGSDTGYDRIFRWWTGGGGEYLPFEKDPLGLMLEPIARSICDALSAMICHGVFDRHPNLRVASVENGADWVGSLLKRFDRSYGQMPRAFSRHPRETFRKHIFVAPSYEDDMDELVTLIPAERILFGSDFPHPEGLAEPLDYLKEFANFSAADIEKIFHGNLKGLLEGARN